MSKKISVLGKKTTLKDADLLTGVDLTLVVGSQNFGITAVSLDARWAPKDPFDTHVADLALHLTTAQNAGLDAADAGPYPPSGANRFLTLEEGNATYQLIGADVGTDLGNIPTLTTVEISSSTGDNTVLAAAGANAGVMTAADKTALTNAVTDQHTHANKGALDKVSDAGAGDAWLANNGQYTVPAGGSSDIADLTDRDSIANKIAVTDGAGNVVMEDKPTPGEAQTQDLGQGTHNTTTLQLTISDGGQPTTLPAATGTLAGLMTSEHQAKVESDDTPTDPRTPTAHDSTHNTHNDARYAGIAHESATNNPHSVLATQISDFDTEVANNTTVAGHTTKLAGIEDGATADQTAAEIKTAYESNADTNAFTDADQTKLGNALTSTGSIGSHTDVDLTGITNDQILKWDGAQFIAAADETGSGVPADAALNGYTELGTNLGAPAATATIPVDGRLYEFNAALTVDLTITVGTKPTAPTCASSVIYVKPGGNTVTFSGVHYWAGGAMPDLGTLMRYVISTTVTGDVLADGEAFS